MTPQELFVARLDAFEAACNNAERAIKSTNAINPTLYRRVAPELLRQIGDQQAKIAGQRTNISRNHFSEGSWNLLHAHEEECSTLFAESLAFVQAARARGHDVDADLCEIADALLDELAASLTNIDWRRFTVLATEEFFRDFAQIIRLRFPFPGIWDLPVAAHEFGHFVAGRLNLARPNGSRYLAFQDYKQNFKKQHEELSEEVSEVKRATALVDSFMGTDMEPPYRQILGSADGDRDALIKLAHEKKLGITPPREKKNAKAGDEWMFYLEEYFADVFATFALGPAYACTCLLLRFDPVSAREEKDKRHPSYIKRAYAILQTLRRMNIEKDSRGDFEPVADALADWWNQELASASQSAALSKDEAAQVASLVSSFYDEMLKSGAPGARFNRWGAAKSQCRWVESAKLPANVKSADLKISDMLNAAWLCRMKAGTDPDSLSDNVIRLCRLQFGVN